MQAQWSGLDMDKLFASVIQPAQSGMQGAMERLTGDPLANYAELYATLLKDYQSNQRVWVELQNAYLQGQMQLWMNFMGVAIPEVQKTEVAAVEKGDKRFTAPEWTEYPLFDYIKQSYLLTSKVLVQAVENANLDDDTKKKMTFFTKQFVDAMSPSNYAATNPEVLKMAMETKGESVAAGLRNLLADLEKGRISMTDESAFEVGKNLAVTPGSVVYENQLIQLIQYAPSTETVYTRPLLMVPPSINKFYIMDLQPDNSLVRYAVEQGHSVFLISWRNIDATTQHLTWNDYLDSGVIKALEVVREVSGQETVNTLGFCVGGTLLACALAVLEAQGKHWAESLTMMTALLEFSYVGDIGVYVDRAFVEGREQLYKTNGVVPGRELALAFSSLRANDLIWSYVVNNYLKGKAPDAFDLLYWNSDATNLPGPMFAYYLRNTYLENNLVKPGCLTMCSVPVDLTKLNMPSYVFAAIEDHIVPWRAAYESARHLGSEPRFVLGASGHIAGSMNSATKNRRSYWVNPKFTENPEDWYKASASRPGSWWNDWAEWLGQFGGEKIKARTKPGSRKYKPIEPAPGRYVKVRVAKPEADKGVLQSGS